MKNEVRLNFMLSVEENKLMIELLTKYIKVYEDAINKAISDYDRLTEENIIANNDIIDYIECYDRYRKITLKLLKDVILYKPIRDTCYYSIIYKKDKYLQYYENLKYIISGELATIYCNNFLIISNEDYQRCLDKVKLETKHLKSLESKIKEILSQLKSV